MEYRQRWDDVLFLHWAYSADVLRTFVPASLEVATYQGQAWVSAVLFRLQVRPRWLPLVPGVNCLVELNIRTYVCREGRPGIWFLGVFGDNPLAVRMARLLTPIPYQQEPLWYERSAGGDKYHYRRRKEPVVTARPVGPQGEVTPDSLSEWLLERYRLFSRSKSGCLVEAEVSHPRWTVQAVEVAGAVGSIGNDLGLELGRPPDAAHFSAGVRAVFGSFRRVAQPVGRNERPPITSP